MSVEGSGLSASRAKEQLSAIASELFARRDAILEAWRAAGEPTDRGIAASLSRAQFNDHVPAVLDCLAHTIEAWPDEQTAQAGQIQSERVCDHGLQRWQQSYQLRELIREWGHLQICVADELERYAGSHPELEPGVMATVRRAWMQLCAEGVTGSATQYWRLHQAESAGHVHDLETALTAVQTLERARAEAWRTAAHDLRGSVTVVKGATTLLQGAGAGRVEAANMLGKSVASLHDMLTDLVEPGPSRSRPRAAGAHYLRCRVAAPRFLCGLGDDGHGSRPVPEDERTRDSAGRGRQGESPAHPAEPVAQRHGHHRRG